MNNKLTSVQLLELIAGCIDEFFEAEKNEHEAENPLRNRINNDEAISNIPQ